MITLVTGSPGAGKTLAVVTELVSTVIPTGRNIVVDIDGFDGDRFDNVSVVTDDDAVPTNWETYPDGTVFVFDEVQRWYPPRNSQSKVPKYIAAYETHRHRGFDFYFITQAPRLIDGHLKPLVGLHQHYYRPFNMKASFKYEWNVVNDYPNPKQTHETAVRTQFKFPKKMFEYYKSASQHTMKLRIPWRVVGIVGAIGLFAGLMIYSIVTTAGNWFDADPELTAVDAYTSNCDATIVALANGGFVLRDGSGIARTVLGNIAHVNPTHAVFELQDGSTIKLCR